MPLDRQCDQIWQNFDGFFLFGKKLSLNWQNLDIIVLFFIVANGQILKNIITIWSHCGSSQGLFCNGKLNQPIRRFIIVMANQTNQSEGLFLYFQICALGCFRVLLWTKTVLKICWVIVCWWKVILRFKNSTSIVDYWVVISANS